MARSLTRRAQAAVETLSQVQVRVIDRVFAGFATIAAIWLAYLLIYQLLTQGVTWLWVFVPFWVLVAYLILPRIHSVLSRIYLPDYFIGRTRTREGLLGDPVNLGIRGDEQRIHAAMMRAGWRRAEELNVFSGLRTVWATLIRRSYEAAPVSSLFLFGRRQSFTYQQEVEGNPAKRHHVRFWPTPSGWLLPGGNRTDWLAAGTFDRSVGLSLFTGQFTHRISADIDLERDHIIDTISDAPGNDGVQVRRLRHYSSGYHHRNGGGDRIVTDGDLPIVDLRPIAEPSPRMRSQIAAAAAAASYRRPVPITVAFGVAMMILRVVIGVVTIGSLIGFDGELVSQLKPARDLIDAGVPLLVLTIVAHVLFVLYLVTFPVLAAYVSVRSSAARSLALVISTGGVGVGALVWWAAPDRGELLPLLGGMAIEILVILALASDTTRLYCITRPPAGVAQTESGLADDGPREGRQEAPSDITVARAPAGPTSEDQHEGGREHDHQPRGEGSRHQ